MSPLFVLSWECGVGWLELFNHPEHVHECPGNLCIDLGMTNKFQWVGKSKNTKSMNNEDQLCHEGNILLPGASVRNPTHDKVMRKEAWQNTRMWSGFRGAPWNFLIMYPQNQKSASLCTLLFHSSDILWKKLIQSFSLLQKNVLA